MSAAGPGADPADKLVRMANQIAAFFRAYPHEEAVAGVQDHITAFWSPVMRRDLLARLDRDADGADPIVLDATHRITHALSPARKATAGPEQAGALGASDAG